MRTAAAIAAEPDAPLDSPEAIAECRAAAINAVRRGEMDPTVGQALSRMLEDQRKALETVDLARRLAALEAGAEPQDGQP